jgi:UDP-3-O-[3-hydroxymyristoyl] glucosamine N-acyltransferase
LAAAASAPSTHSAYSLPQLAQRLGATLQSQLPAEALEAITIHQLAHPRLARTQADLIYAPSPAAYQALQQPGVQCALVEAGAPVPENLLAEGKVFVVVPRLRLALAELLSLFEKPAWLAPGLHPTAVVHESATLGQAVTVGPYAVVGPGSVLEDGVQLHAHVSVGANCQLGQGSLLHAGVRVGDRVQLGQRVILQPNAVIGADGFSYVTPEKGSIESAKASGGSIEAQNTLHRRINSVGTVVLEDDVEVGACTTIDRGTLAETRIAKGTKIDNLVQIGHNNTVGEHCLIVSQVGLAGSCKVGNRVVIAGQSGFADHLSVGDDAIVMARSGVMRDVEAKTVVGGAPAMPRKQAFETMAYMSKVKPLYQDVKAMKKQLAQLQEQLAALTQAEETAAKPETIPAGGTRHD